MTANVWFGAVVLGLVLYVAMDGNDLGVGILALGVRDLRQRRGLLDLVASVWDGNESWILLIAVGLWGGFPAATGGLLPAVYPLLIVMVWSLIVRGASIEMISNSGDGWPRWWGRAFMGGSLLAAFVQGMTIGAVIQGVPLGAGQRFTGDSFGFFSGFSVLTGLATVVLYSVHGAALVRMRSADPATRALIGGWGRRLVLLLAGLAALTGALIPVAGAASLTLGQPLRIALIVWMCVAAGLGLFLAWWALGTDRHGPLAFTAVALAEVAGAVGLVVLSYPDILPPSLTIAAAASPARSLDLLIGGFGMLIPVTMAYNAYAFWVLRPRRARGQHAATAEAGQ